KLGKNWDKKRLADAHYAIDLAELAAREGVVSPDEVAEMRKALVLDNIGAMPPDQYAALRRSGQLEATIEACAEPDNNKSWRDSQNHRQQITDRVANWAHQRMSDAGAIDDAEFVSQLRKHRGLPRELLDANGDPAASDEYISAEMGAINLAKLQNVPHQ